MAIIAQHLDRVLTNPALDLSHFALTADRLAWDHDSIGFELSRYPGPGWQQDDEERPTAPPDFSPTPEDMAECLGYDLGLEGREIHPNDGTMAPKSFVRYIRGLAHGKWERAELAAREKAEFEAWLDSVEDPEARAAYDDCVRSRSYVGHHPKD